ncbi:MAG: biotin--[acetyl-CoA-carboxylase] ligase [Nocardioidaceae bacterium]|nr:biotin--[acetyl-CoA-carboxylase] ligase [Nocardioidaceae bacterium]
MNPGTVQHPARGPLDHARLTAALAADPGLGLELLDVAPSTNQVASERARAGAAQGLVVVADHQAAGRGRLDRSWQTPPGTAATFSLLLRPTAPAARWPWLPLLVGHQVGAALSDLGYAARLKWPNDVLLDVNPSTDSEDLRKVAGILVERVETDQGPAAIVGVGINVAMSADELPVETATSLIMAGPAAPDRSEVIAAVVLAIGEGYHRWQREDVAGSSALAESYRARCATLGREVRVELPGGGRWLGRAVDVDADGRLVVSTAEGEQRVGAGDVVHVRNRQA